MYLLWPRKLVDYIACVAFWGGAFTSFKEPKGLMDFVRHSFHAPGA